MGSQTWILRLLELKTPCRTAFLNFLISLFLLMRVSDSLFEAILSLGLGLVAKTKSSKKMESACFSHPLSLLLGNLGGRFSGIY